LTAAERGSLLHHVLESIWSTDTPEPFRMVALADLKQVIASGRLDEALRFHIGNTFAPLAQKNADDPWMQAYLESEQRRLLIRLREWMECEAQRQPFEVIAREQRLDDVSVGDLKLHLRADRIDALPDGTRLILDYKTSDVSTKKWRGERPDEPQLPLYAVYGNVENISGLLFARIRAGKTAFVGRVADARQQLQENLSASSPLVNEPFDDSMRDGWQQALWQLAEEFLHGEASVDPKDGASTCQYCPLPGLCRVAETNRVLDEGEDIDH
jgi:RecB family exonuclease